MTDNPFKDNLFNSENLPVTKAVEINENYLEPSSLNEILKRRKNKGKQRGVSIHEFNEEEKKQISDTANALKDDLEIVANIAVPVVV